MTQFCFLFQPHTNIDQQKKSIALSRGSKQMTFPEPAPEYLVYKFELDLWPIFLPIQIPERHRGTDITSSQRNKQQTCSLNRKNARGTQLGCLLFFVQVVLPVPAVTWIFPRGVASRFQFALANGLPRTGHGNAKGLLAQRPSKACPSWARRCNGDQFHVP